MIQRRVIENLDTERLTARKYVFVGFNSLDKAERALFKAIQGTGKAMFYWDYDPAYTEGSLQHEAGRFLRDVQRGTVQVDEAKPLRDYITEYMAREKNDRIHRFAQAFGLNENLLREIMNNYMQGDIIPQGPLDQLKESVDKSLAKAWFEQHEGVAIPAFRINIRIDSLLRQFIEDGGFEI